jgi:hypothetical protein
MPEQMLKVMISSTARDLPLHRKEVLDACVRQSMFPLMMEHLPASDADAIQVSLRMVDEADLYLSIFAHGWGLEAARAHLQALGAHEPADLPPFDPVNYEPMPEAEIDRLDEPDSENDSGDL